MNKKLTKSANPILCGVCGGIAEYFDIDPTIVRIGWGVLTVFSMGLMIILYLVCCVVMPKK